MKSYRYSVEPFSQRSPKATSFSPGGTYPCAICCLPVKTATCRFWAVLVDGGAAWGNEDSEQDPGYMGLYPIGSNCHRRYVVKD